MSPAVRRRRVTDLLALTAALVGVPSVSHHEAALGRPGGRVAGRHDG